MKILKANIILLLIFFNAWPQDFNTLKDWYYEAEDHFYHEEFEEALPLYLKLSERDSLNANLHYRIGACYLNLPGMQADAIKHLQLAIRDMGNRYREGYFGERSAPPNALFHLGMAYHLAEDFDKALSSYREFKATLPEHEVEAFDYVDRQINTCQTAIDMIGDPLDYKMEALAEKINKPGANYFPVVSGNRKVLVYIHQSGNQSYFYYSRLENGQWGDPVDISQQLGVDITSYPTSLNHDGTVMYLYQEKKYQGDIYRSGYNEGKWTKAVALDKEINTRFNETHASLSPDGNTLYFTSDRRKGFGGTDIYMITRDDEGEWDEAINLGPGINTPFHEETPFISNDGDKLYFSSQGHVSMGGFDIFSSVKNADGQWSYPNNLGYPLNTTGDNLFYQPIGEEAGYLSALAPEKNEGSRLYRVDLSSSPEKPSLVTINGKVWFSDNRPGYPGLQILVIDTLTGDTTSVEPDPENGNYTCQLPPAYYKIAYAAEGYNSKIEFLEIPENFQQEEKQVSTELVHTKVSQGEYLTIKGIYFDKNKSELSAGGKAQLEKIALAMKRYPGLYIDVIGHADVTGEKQYNFKLAAERAKAAIDYLTGRDIDANRFVAKSVGTDEQIAINFNPDGSINEAGQKYNRRVDLKVFKSDEDLVIDQQIDLPKYLRKEIELPYTVFLGVSGNEGEQKYFAYTENDSVIIKRFKARDRYILTMGDFASKGDALPLLNAGLDAGMAEAKVINYHEINYLIDYHKIEIKNRPRPASKYTVQMLALRNQLAPENIPIPDVKVSKGPDAYYRYTSGEFESYEKALEKWDQVIQSGFTKAFIRKTGEIPNYYN